jgi:hypothetical protein
MKRHFQTQRQLFERACHFSCMVSNLKSTLPGGSYEHNTLEANISQPQSSSAGNGSKSALAKKGAV